jgi:hypothetical protein
MRSPNATTLDRPRASSPSAERSARLTGVERDTDGGASDGDHTYTAGTPMGEIRRPPDDIPFGQEIPTTLAGADGDRTTRTTDAGELRVDRTRPMGNSISEGP